MGDQEGHACLAATVDEDGADAVADRGREGRLGGFCAAVAAVAVPAWAPAGASRPAVKLSPAIAVITLLFMATSPVLILLSDEKR
ncbi:hypothetical protein ABZ917_46640 [Nonomuraea wenchangensis]